MVRRTHARDRMPQHGSITAHWKSGQQAAGRPGSARFATEGCTCSAKTRGKAGQKRGLALGHITTEQATDLRTVPSASDWYFGFVFQRKRGKKTLSTQILWRIGFTFFTLRRFGSSRYRRATLAIELEVDLSKWIFPISLRFVPCFFFATLALFIFTLRRLGATTLAIERGGRSNLPEWRFPIIVALRSIAVLVR